MGKKTYMMIQIYNKLLEKHPFENSQNLPINININVTCVESHANWSS